MELIGTITPERPLLVMALHDEAQAYEGDLPLLVTGLGKVNAAAALATVLGRGPLPAGVINLGTAGALRPGWSGTHAIGTVIQHDLDSELLRRLTNRSWADPIALPDRAGPALASGDTFVADSLARERLAHHAALVDMEGYALAVAARQAGVPIRIVKHVSDDADEHAARTWNETVAECSHALAAWVAANAESLIDQASVRTVA